MFRTLTDGCNYQKAIFVIDFDFQLDGMMWR